MATYIVVKGDTFDGIVIHLIILSEILAYNSASGTKTWSDGTRLEEFKQVHNEYQSAHTG